MKTISILIIFFTLSSWHEKTRVIELEITRQVNNWYRETKDVDGYAEIARSGWDDNVINRVMLRSV